ncbi:MAG: TonB-dependent receptor [Ignavibacteriales bacterium]|nr:TonB-dependent receptor [Ignavibacteriales bacterium]
MKKIFYCLLTLTLLQIKISAQSGPRVAATINKSTGQGVISGKVIDASVNSPIEYASIILLSKQNSQMVNGIASDKNGEFLLSGIPNGVYNLSISFIGFKKKEINDVQISDGSQFVNLKEIKLLSDAVTMKESEVIAEKSAVEFKIDKKVVNVSQNLSATGGTAVDVLQNQPSVQIDANGNLSLRGSGNFTVMVDGKPSVLQGTDALRQIPANIIDNIEIITNPSAKYDAEGTAGIINIVTKKTNVTNTSGIANSGAGSRDKYNGDFNLGYRTPDYNLNIGGDARRYNNFQDISVDRTQLSTTGINSRANIHNKRDAFNGRFAFDRYFSDKVTLGITGSYGYVDMNMGVNTYNNVSDLMENSSGSYAHTDDQSKTTAEYFNGSLNFSNIFTPKVNDLYFEATFTKLKLPSNQFTTENTILSDGTTQINLRGRENNTSRIDSRIKLNYKHNLVDKNTFETGLQATLFYKKIDIISKDFNNDSQLWILNNTFSNNFDFRNNIYAAFATYTDKILGLDYQAGMRLEYTDRLLDQLTSNVQFKYQKLHLFPTLNISKKISEDQQMQFSYSRRIQRPYDGQLNPYTYFSDTYTSTGGNPYLVPSFTHSLELNYQKSFTGVYLTVQTYFRKTEDGIEQLQEVDNTGRLNLIPENVLNTTSAGAEITANVTFAPWFKMDPVFNFYHFTLEEKPQLGIQGQNTFSWDARLNTTVMLSAATRIQFFTNYYPKNVTSQGEIKTFMIIGASVRQEFLEKQLIATLSAQNLFGQTKFNIVSNGTGFTSNLFVRPEAPIFNLSLSYNFNNFKRRSNEQVDVNVNSGF